MAILLTLAGQKRTTGVLGVWDGGAVVQLGEDGVWSELASGDTVAWNLQNFECAGAHVLFHIRSSGFGSLNCPHRGQLHRSVDQGATWADVTPSSGGTEYVVDVAKDADDDFWCITGELEDQGATPNNEPCRVYKSADYGETWTLSYLIPETSFTTRNWQAFNITCHPTDANIIVVEGTEMVGWNSRLWRTTDGGSSWSAALTPTFPGELAQVQNVGGQKEHIFDYTLGGDLVYAGIFEIANDDLFVLKSLDDGDTFGLYYTESDVVAYGAAFQEATLVYFLHRDDLFQSAAPVGPGQVTKIADNNDAPWSSTNYIFHGLSRHEVGDADTLHIGVYLVGPGAGATDDPSVWTRPADLGSGWAQHTSWDTMESDLGYRLYVAINGVVGATEFEALPPRPLPPDEPPGGGGPSAPPGGEPGISEPGIAEPGTGLAKKMKRDLARSRRRGPAEAQQVRKRTPEMLADQIDKSQTPSTAAEPVARRWMPFGWLIGAVVEGHKTMTLRDWDPVEGVQWNQGELFYAYDQSPVEGGKRWALLRVASQPYSDMTSKLKKGDFEKLGYGYAMATQAAPPSGRTIEQMWSDMMTKPKRLWVVRFTVERLYDQLAPQRGTVEIAKNENQEG